ncbi:MAG TPA: PDZ domain-containing protein [Terriglobales bacterium]|nr:PDZ domain-containing protein [Terriglobales bacterium]
MPRAILTSVLLMCLAVAASAAGFLPGSNGSFGDSSEGFFEGESYLGVDTRDITPDRMEPLHLKEETGVEVTLVDQDAPAGKAGIKEHDVIMSINDEKVESVEQLRRLIHEIPAGRVISIGIFRDGKPLTLKAELGDRNKLFHFESGPKEFKFEMPSMPAIPDVDLDLPVSVVIVHSSLRSGLMVENLTPQLGDFFGVKNGKGVLVRSVERGSRAEKAGFHAGDVIVRVNDQPVNDSGDFSHALRGRKDNSVSVVVIRDRKEQTLTLTLPDRSQSGMQEESLELPRITAQMDLTRMQSELARVKPEIEAYTQEMRRIQPELERSMRQLQQKMQCLEQQKREQSRELRRQQERLRQELRLKLRQGLADI